MVIPFIMKGQSSPQRVIQKYSTISLVLLCVVFVSHGLLVWGHDSWLSDKAYDDDSTNFVDFTDMVNYDPVKKEMVNKHDKEQVQHKCDCDEYQKTLAKCREDFEACYSERRKCKMETVPVDPSPKEACAGEEMFFRRFARHIVDKLAAEASEDGEIEARITVRLPASSWQKLRDFVYNKKGRMAEAYDYFTEMMSHVDHTNVTTYAMWLEDVFQMDRTHLKFIVGVIALATIIVVFETHTTKSWGYQLLIVFIFLIALSFFWNWIYLYKKAVSDRMSVLHKEVPDHCRTGKMNLLDTFTEVMRSRFTFNNDPCKLRNEKMFVDPWVEVPPTKAMVLTFVTLFLDPLKYLGKAVAEFNHELFGNLPLQAWIPALLSVYGSIGIAVFICLRCSWNYRRQPNYQYLPPPKNVRPLAVQDRRPDRGQQPGIEDVPFQPHDLELEASSFQKPQLPPGQDTRRRLPKRSTSRQRKTSERQGTGSSSNCNTDKLEPVASVVLSQKETRGRSGSTSDSEASDINVIKRGDEEKFRRRVRSRSVSPPKLSTKLTLAEATDSKKSDGGRPMSHPESEQSSVEPTSLMQSVDSSTLLVASTKHMPPITLGDMGEVQGGSKEGSLSSDGSTPTLSPPQCNTPSSISVLGDEASLGSSDDMTQDRRPALERVHLSVSGGLEPDILGAVGGSVSGREGSQEDDDDFEVLHKEQLSQPL